MNDLSNSIVNKFNESSAHFRKNYSAEETYLRELYELSLSPLGSPLHHIILTVVIKGVILMDGNY